LSGILGLFLFSLGLVVPSFAQIGPNYDPATQNEKGQPKQQSTNTSFFYDVVQFFEKLFGLENPCKTTMGELIDSQIKFNKYGGLSEKDSQEYLNLQKKEPIVCKDVSIEQSNQWWNELVGVKLGYPLGVNACKEEIKKIVEINSNAQYDRNWMQYVYTQKERAEIDKIQGEIFLACPFYSSAQKQQWYDEAMQNILK